jgi:hypothetical protein
MPIAPPPPMAMPRNFIDQAYGVDVGATFIRTLVGLPTPYWDVLLLCSSLFTYNLRRTNDLNRDRAMDHTVLELGPSFSNRDPTSVFFTLRLFSYVLAASHD